MLSLRYPGAVWAHRALAAVMAKMADVQSRDQQNQRNLKTKLLVETLKTMFDHHAEMSHLDDEHLHAVMDFVMHSILVNDVESQRKNVKLRN